jgi:EmrB/QacA subfamily drug resistance transporter
MAIFMAAVEATIVATAMPTIVADLGGFRLFTWVFTAYLLTTAATIPIYGRLADLYGRKRVFFAGGSLFLVGSVLCGFARSMVMLIVLRGLQGMGAGAVHPIATTIVGDLYTPEERARKQGYVSGVFGLASIIGPGLGALLVEGGRWPLIFWINVPIGLVAFAMLGAFLHERLEPKRQQLDYVGSALLTIGIGTLMLALVQASRLGWLTIAGLLLTALTALTALAIQETRVPQPMLPVALFRNPFIVIGNLGGLTIGAVMMGLSAFLPTYLQGVSGRSATLAGTVLALESIWWTVGSILAGRAMIRTSYRLTSTLGGGLLVLGTGVLVALEPHHAVLWASAGASLVGLGMGFCNTSLLVSVQASVTWRERGVATSSTMFARIVGGALGAATFGAILNVGMSRHAGAASETVNRLMTPAVRATVEPAELARLVEALARSLHAVFLTAGALAAITLALMVLLPRGIGPRRSAADGY